ncbi:DUF763 domain-containing protein [Thermogladius sp.]|jgi:hypothetical protein|uniref:DUF763 domain-containing protein n=1 Tax=Thermogladius sp. TaxID=2023064 RepID=UPI003D0F62B0
MSLEGVAELPLHEGSVPTWLLRIMERMSLAILRIMVEEFGPDKVVERFSNPLWFQGFNNVIGMDWDSSGSTTVLTGVLKSVTWRSPDLGLLVLGGKGGNARRVPQEVATATRLFDLGDEKARELEKASRLVAKVDSALFQAGYTLYHHALFLSENGVWSIVQQGMNLEKKTARRYHWKHGTSFFSDPHEAVSGTPSGKVLNIVDSRAEGLRRVLDDLVKEGLERVSSLYSQVYNSLKGQVSLTTYLTETGSGSITRVAYGDKGLLVYQPLPHPFEVHRLFKSIDVVVDGFEDLVLARGVGAKTMRALALVSHLVYDEPPGFDDRVDTPLDPFVYSYAIGGKDGVPYRVRRREAEEVVSTLEDIINRAKLGDKDKLRAFKKLRELKIRVVGKYI